MRVLIVIVLMLFQTAHAANHVLDRNDPYIKYLIPKIIGYSHEKNFLKHMNIMNYKHHKLNHEALESLEQQWQKEQKSRRKSLHESVMENPISEYLTKIEKNSSGLFNDIVALDKKGIVVGMTGTSHKYSRAHEEKFAKAWSVGPNGTYISPFLFSPSVGKSLIYISVTITDRTHDPIGVLIVGVDKDIMEATLTGKISA